MFPLLLVTHPSVPAKSVAELIALAKAKPGELNFASAGSGGAAPRGGALQPLGGHQHGPCAVQGTGPAVLGVLGGQVSLMFASVPSVIQHVRGGKLNALAVVTRAQRSPAAPELPTVSEQGLRAMTWCPGSGSSAPAGTPADIVKRLNEDVRRVLVVPEFQERLKDEGGRSLVMTPEEFTAFIRSEAVRWAKIVRDVGAKLD